MNGALHAVVPLCSRWCVIAPHCLAACMRPLNRT